MQLSTAAAVLPLLMRSNLCRELFEAWCEDPKNGIIIADFAVAGTLAREVLDEPKEIMSHSGHKVHRLLNLVHVTACFAVKALNLDAHLWICPTRQYM